MKSIETTRGPVLSRPYTIEFKPEEMQRYKGEIDGMTNFLKNKPKWKELREKTQRKRVVRGKTLTQGVVDAQKIYDHLNRKGFSETDYTLLSINLFMMMNMPQWNKKFGSLQPQIRAVMGGAFDTEDRMHHKNSTFNCYDASLIVSSLAKSYGIDAKVTTNPQREKGHVFVVTHANGEERVIDVMEGWANVGLFSSMDEYNEAMAIKRELDKKNEKKSFFTSLFKKCH